jgi:hypothetical protein
LIARCRIARDDSGVRLGRLREGGFSAQTAYHPYHVLDGHTFLDGLRRMRADET